MSIYGHYKFSYILGYIYCRITRKSTINQFNYPDKKDPKSVLQDVIWISCRTYLVFRLLNCSESLFPSSNSYPKRHVEMVANL